MQFFRFVLFDDMFYCVIFVEEKQRKDENESGKRNFCVDSVSIVSGIRLAIEYKKAYLSIHQYTTSD